MTARRNDAFFRPYDSLSRPRREGAQIWCNGRPRSEEHATGNPSGLDEREDGYAHTEERPGTITSSVTMGYLLGDETER
jgi:hypothetical protein